MSAVTGSMLAALLVEERLRDVKDARRDAYVRSWARALLRVLRVDVALDAAPGALERRARPRLVVANHRSTVDILLLLELFGGNFLARGDMADWPAIGPLSRRAGTLFVDRGDAASGASAIRRIRDRLRKGVSISVFPEGTTFEGDEVREFQPGAFIAIARERGEIVPVGIAYESADAIYGDEPVTTHMKRLVRAPYLRVGVAIGEPIDASGRAVRSLAGDLRSAVQALVARARAKVGGEKNSGRRGRSP